ncbi:MAG: hemin uptake protein HemP [Ramlibacter sp.]
MTDSRETPTLPLQPPGGQAAIQASSGDAARQVHSTDLLRGSKAVEINHNGAVYRLQATKLGKLILTK